MALIFQNFQWLSLLPQRRQKKQKERGRKKRGVLVMEQSAGKVVPVTVHNHKLGGISPSYKLLQA